MATLDRVQRLVERALDDFDAPSQKTSGLLRQCIRIATLRNDFTNLLWLEMETFGFDPAKPSTGPLSDLGDRMRTVMTDAEIAELISQHVREYQDRRALPGATINARPVDEIEGMLESAAAGISYISAAPGDSAMRINAVAKSKIEVENAMQPHKHVLIRIRGRLHRFLVDTERQLEFGQVNSDVFERIRQDVDSALGELAPSALAKFASATKRVSEGDAEALSQALTSCRRVLKATADAVYPATGEKVTGTDGRLRSMTDDAYINRLLQAVADSVGKHANGKVVEATLEALGKRLVSLNELASKGVHAEVTRDEVDTCVVQTYLVVGDVLRFARAKNASPRNSAQDAVTA